MILMERGQKGSQHQSFKDHLPDIKTKPPASYLEVISQAVQKRNLYTPFSNSAQVSSVARVLRW